MPGGVSDYDDNTNYGGPNSTPAASSQSLSNVYWGRRTNPGTGAYVGSILIPAKKGDWLTDEKRGQSIYRNDTLGLYQRMVSVGALSKQASVGGDSMKQQWALAQQISASSYVDQQAGRGKAVTPYEALVLMGKQNRSGGSGGAYGGGAAPFSGTKNQTSTNTQLNLSSPGQAKAMVDDALSAGLGRNATLAERKQFLKALNAEERKHPNKSVTKTSTVYKAGDAVSSNSKTTVSGGMEGEDKALMAEEAAQKKPGYAAFQKAVPMYDAFLQAINSPVDGV